MLGGAASPVPGHGQIEEIRIELMQPNFVEPKLGHDSATEILEQYMEVGYKSCQHVLAYISLQIERQGSFAQGVFHEMGVAVPLTFARIVVGEKPGCFDQ